MSYYLIEKSLRRRDTIFKEGDISEGIYFIKDGEFEVSSLTFFSRLLIIIIENYNNDIMFNRLQSG